MNKKWFADCDKTIIITILLVFAILLTYGFTMPDQFASLWDSLNGSICENFGWLYIGLVFFFLCYFIYIAISKYGKLRLGDDDEKPEHSNFAWISMLFSAGVGIGFVYWGVAEPLTHFMSPPYLVEPESQGAMLQAVAICTTHWGVMGWVPYTMAGLPIAIAAYRYKKPLALSSAMYGILGDKTNGPLGKVVDILSVIATFAGISTTLGFAVLSICYACERFFGMPNTILLNLVVTVIMAGLFLLSSLVGIKKGMSRVSRFSVIMAIVVMIFLVICGPTRVVLDSLVASLGCYLDNFFFTHTWTDPIDTSGGWLNWWTVFYIGWYLAWAPFVGGFIARISKGRTIKEFLLGVIFVPIILTYIWFCIVGTSAIEVQRSVADIWPAVSADASSATYALLEQLPISSVMCFIVMITMLAFGITSIDASAFFAATVMSRGNDPGKPVKLLCGILIAAISFFLLASGGLKSLQTMSIVGAFPFAIIAIFLIVSTYKMLVMSYNKSYDENGILRSKAAQQTAEQTAEIS